MTTPPGLALAASEPAFAPGEVGWKRTLTAQVPLAESAMPLQPSAVTTNCVRSAPPRETEIGPVGDVSVFLTMKLVSAELEPCTTEPKSFDIGVMVKRPAV